MAPKLAHQQRPAPDVHVTASALVVDGWPASDDNFCGIAVKQIPASSDLARSEIPKIQISEKYLLLLDGEVDIINGSTQGGPGLALAKGTEVYINDATNALVLAATALTTGVLNAGFSKYGKVSYLAPERGLPPGWATINLDQAPRIKG